MRVPPDPIISVYILIGLVEYDFYLPFLPFPQLAVCLSICAKNHRAGIKRRPISMETSGPFLWIASANPGRNILAYVRRRRQPVFEILSQLQRQQIVSFSALWGYLRLPCSLSIDLPAPSHLPRM
ncbi:Hypothetical predicted protein [Podarcis lilfordi]|uniref:Uncharacterized protein n=1 Tax=Podarcis lilfordi TaxID=74358 RepID=A0AA35NV65_9SAUR|nr:Hypothetical predicted protein [Podarcis lilfordi]